MHLAINVAASTVRNSRSAQISVVRLTFVVISVFAIGTGVGATEINFSRDVRPILSDKCFQCHGPDQEQREADLRLDHKQGLYGDSDSDSDLAIVKPKHPDASELFRRLISSDEDNVMPPPDSGKTLSKEEIEIVRQWIDQGAQWEEHWAFVPPTRPSITQSTDDTWSRSMIDLFVRRRLKQEKLQPEPEASRRNLARRLYLDLLGLPPSSEELRAFENDLAANAYERLVDRLLKSPHFGERMTTFWLDQARYADTNGYSIDGGRHMWLWRDWVINAFNENKPFDQFIVEQLAGDLLPNANLDQRVATGFNRNHMITHEGGTIPAENLVNYVADRVRTTSEVFLGLTMGCAQCHDHKYDPISQHDYYRFFAYFNTISDRGLDGNAGVNASPKLQATSILARRSNEIEQLRDELETLEATMTQSLVSQNQWEDAARHELSHLGEKLELHPVQVIKVTSPNRGGAYDVLEDGTVFLPSPSGRSPSISAKIDVDDVTGFRLVFSPDDRFPKKGVGHGKRDGLQGSFVLTSFSGSATTVPSDQVDLYKILPIAKATASGSHQDFPPHDCLDERDINGWSPGETADPAHITFQFEQPLHASETPFVTVMLVWGHGGRLSAGKYRLYAITGRDDGINLPEDIRSILAIATNDRSAEQAERMRSYHATVAPELANVRYQIDNLQRRIDYLSKPQDVMVMNHADKPRDTHVLVRGQYDQRAEKVSMGTPASLPPLPKGAPANRLGLANWLVQADHPLTARVTVNRFWQMLFGTGIVATGADFGAQGEPPSHPELLDWLAIDFAEGGWDVKATMKKIVMSSTYRQSSRVSKEKLAVDPNNRLFSRGARFRLQAEFLRDTTLKVSGLLVHRLGGPSVKPYQPPLLWREISHFGSTPATAQVFVQDHGERLYRRSMYTYWKRTLPPPSMVGFDAPNRELCTIQRSRTNTPLQALVLLNDPQFVEASRAFAEKILKEPETETSARIDFAFLEALSRSPTDKERAIVTRAVRRELSRYQNDPKAARGYLKIGEHRRDETFDVAEHAAWSVVANMVLNLSETLTRN